MIWTSHDTISKFKGLNVHFESFWTWMTPRAKFKVWRCILLYHQRYIYMCTKKFSPWTLKPQSDGSALSPSAMSFCASIAEVTHVYQRPSKYLPSLKNTQFFATWFMFTLHPHEHWSSTDIMESTNICKHPASGSSIRAFALYCIYY